MGIFDFIGDAEQAVEHAVSDTVDAVREIPGLGDAIGLVEDFARTDVGKTFLRFVSPMAVPILWQITWVGPALAPFAYALPGLARGEKLGTAYAEEFKALAKQVGQHVFETEMPKALAAGEDMARAAGKIAGQFPDPEHLKEVLGGMAQRLGLPIDISIDDLVKRFAEKNGLREDVARAAIDQITGLPPASMTLYDAGSGAKRRVFHPAELHIQAPAVKKNFTNPLLLGFQVHPSLKLPTNPANLAHFKLTTPPVRKVTSVAKTLHALEVMGPGSTLGTKIGALTLAHDVLSGRRGSGPAANHISSGQGEQAAVMQDAVAILHRLEIRRIYVDKYLGRGA